MSYPEFREEIFSAVQGMITEDISMELLQVEKLNGCIRHGIAFTKEEDDKLDRIDATLTSFTLESISLFIVGDKDASSDADWNEYVKMLNEYKLDDKIAVYQAAYDRK